LDCQKGNNYLKEVITLQKQCSITLIEKPNCKITHFSDNTKFTITLIVTAARLCW